MSKKETFDEVKIIKLTEHIDARGFFSETYNKDLLSSLNIHDNFIQDNQSFSKKSNTLRGMHFQLPPFDQSKLLRVISGSIFDVFIDLREKSNKYESYGTTILTPESGLLYIPSGFAHGFITLSNETEISYKVNNYYNKESELGIRWDDPFFSIDWPISSKQCIISDKDNDLPFWNDIREKVNFLGA